MTNSFKTSVSTDDSSLRLRAATLMVAAPVSADVSALSRLIRRSVFIAASAMLLS